MPFNPTVSKDVRHVKWNMEKELNIMGTYAINFDMVQSTSAALKRMT